jgi:UDP-N-acetylglucosamine transferase subunit ALG13
LLKKNATVIISAEGRALALLQNEFPNLEYIPLRGVDIRYSTKNFLVLKIIFSIPKIVNSIWQEHQILKKIIIKKKIDIVISDNRFGLWNKSVKSIFITHQLMIKLPGVEKLLHKINLYFIKKYDECWIPDVEESNNLSGDLSHNYPLPNNAFFIGVLSRFQKKETPTVTAINYDVMAILSGPEPQRSILEKLLIKQVQQSKLKALIVCGKTEIAQKKETLNTIEIVSHLNADEMQQAILKSNIIISRSGYSTIMDLAILGKKAIFIATPGQTEQEYLAKFLKEKEIAFCQQQSKFNLIIAMKEVEKYKGFEVIENNNLLEKRIDALSFLPRRH